jgi:ankyrin repeat protein
MGTGCSSLADNPSNVHESNRILPQSSNVVAEINHQFLRAAREGNLLLVTNLIHLGANINALDNNQSTALLLACDYNHTDLAIYLLTVPGVLVNHQNVDNETALIMAVEKNNHAVVTALLAFPGILVNKMGGKNNDTALIVAARKGYLEVAKALLAAPNIMVNQKNIWGNTALSNALRKKQNTLVSILLKAKADLREYFLQAIREGNVFFVTKYISYFNNLTLNKMKYEGKTVITLALEKQNVMMVNALILGGANLHANLMQYIDEQNTLYVKALIPYLTSSALNSERKTHNNPLMLAVYKGNQDIVQALISAGADVNTALILSIKQGKTKLQTALIHLGADLDYAIKNCLEKQLAFSSMIINKMLLISSKEGYLSAVDTLLKLGANIDTTDISGKTPLILASIGNHTSLVSALIVAGASPHMVTQHGNTALKLAVENEHIDTVKALLTASGRGINKKDISGECALIYATKGRRSTPILKVLLDAPDINLNITDGHGDTSLIWAARYGWIENVALLIFAGADLNVRSKSGHTALYSAVLAGNDAIVALLISDMSKLKIDLSEAERTLNYTSKLLDCHFERHRLKVFFQLCSVIPKENIMLIVNKNHRLKYYFNLYHNELEQVTNSMSTFVSAMKTKMEINLVLKVLTMVRPEWYPDSLYGIKIKNVISRNPLSQEHSPVKPVVFSPVLHFQKSTEETKKIIKKVGELRITRCKPKVKVK